MLKNREKLSRQKISLFLTILADPPLPLDKRPCFLRFFWHHPLGLILRSVPGLRIFCFLAGPVFDLAKSPILYST